MISVVVAVVAVPAAAAAAVPDAAAVVAMLFRTVVVLDVILFFLAWTACDRLRKRSGGVASKGNERVSPARLFLSYTKNRICLKVGVNVVRLSQRPCRSLFRLRDSAAEVVLTDVASHATVAIDIFVD